MILGTRGDIASYVVQDPMVRAVARYADGRLNMAALAKAFESEWAFKEIWDAPPIRR